jgi:hypothetical protein
VLEERDVGRLRGGLAVAHDVVKDGASQFAEHVRMALNKRREDL